MEYLIRECQKKDLAGLMQLCARHAFYERAEYSTEDKHEKLKEAIFNKQPKLYCLVGEVQDELIGYATYTFDYSTWDAQSFLYLDCLYIDESFRGFGIGEQIIKKLKTIAFNNECANIQWQTPIWNLRAIKFYKRIGAINNDTA